MQRIRMILINIWIFPRSKVSKTFGDILLNEILLHIISNVWIRYLYVYGFYLVLLKRQAINMVEMLEIYGNVYEMVIEHFYKNSNTE